jgi:hypothetical protein
MHYMIYKTTNLLDGKFYIGKHQTKNIDDGYLGSGKYLKAAIKKHGKENFKKEILEILETEEEMNLKEAELVVVSKDSYNLCEGGNGGFRYINKHPKRSEWSKRGAKHPNAREGARQGGIIQAKNKLGMFVKEFIRPISLGFKDQHHTEESKEKMRRSHNSASHPKGPRGPYKTRKV